MLICFLSTVHTARDKRVFEKEAVSLADAGFRVVHLCPGTEETTVERGVQIITYEPRPGLLKRFLGIPSLYGRARALRADCYHCNEVESWLVGLALKLTTRALVVFDVHEMFPDDLAEFHAPRRLRPLVAGSVRALFRVLVPFTDRLVFAKPSVGVDFVGSESKQTVVQNFVPVRMLEGAYHAPADASPRSSTGVVTAIHVGMISRVRGWPQLLDAMALEEAQGIHLKVVGEFVDGSQADFERRVTELGLSARVQTRGWLSPPDAFREIESSDVGLVLFQPGFRSHTHSLPHKLFDYMLVAVPVVVPDFAVEVGAIVRDADCGRLVDPSRPAAIAKVLGELARAPEERRRLGGNGRRAVLAKYNWEAEAEVLVAMYAGLSSQHAARQGRARA